MESLKTILTNYLMFVVVFAVCLVIIFILALILGKKGTKKSIYLYGLFMDYQTPQIMSLTLFILNFLLLGYSLIFKQSLSIALIVVCMILTIMACLISCKFIKTVINILMEIVSLVIVYFGKITNDLVIKTDDNKYLILQILIMFSGLLFYIFSTFKYVKDIKRKDEINAKN